MNELLSLPKVLFGLFVPIAIVFIAGSNIPLPGIDTAFITRQSSGFPLETAPLSPKR
jgi:preprotein translocase subunit SecY